MAARLAPEIIRQSAEDERIQVEEVDMEKILSQGLGPQDIMDDKHEVHCATSPIICLPLVELKILAYQATSSSCTTGIRSKAPQMVAVYLRHLAAQGCDFTYMLVLKGQDVKICIVRRAIGGD